MSAINPQQHLNVNVLSLKKISNENATKDELERIMKEILDNKIHGISFSAYTDEQDPSLFSQITEEQIRGRMEIIKSFTQWVRIFSCTCGNENAPRIAHEMGLKTLVGAWLGKDLKINEEEIESIIRVAKEGYADIVAIGNEVLLREDLSADELITYINRVKKELPGIKVGYVDAYYVFKDYPEVTEACDVILANCYPFWEYCNVEQSIDYMKLMYATAVKAANGKEVIISETGWPNLGSVLGGAIPSYDNAMKYFVNAYKWANEENIKLFYFSSFDEEWKTHHEGDCGSSWGLWDKDGNYKYSSLYN